MSRILLRDLEPGRLYHIQARATNGDQASQWSQIWDLQTTSDLMPPAAPSGLTWTVEGTAFKAVWTGPTTNQDGSPLKDFRDFQVKVYSPAAPATIITYYTTSARFDFTFEANLNSFGTPRATVNIEVRARDNTGNLSTAATASATNPPPANVTGFTATGISDAVALKWNANSDADLKFYKVWQGTAAGSENNLVYTGLGTSFVFDTLSTNPQYFKIVAVDVFNTESATPATASATAKSSLAVDVTPPASPTGVTVTSAVDSSDASGGRAYIDVSWTGVADTDLQNYSVRYSTGTTWEYINVPEGVTTARINGLRPNTAYNVAVAAVDFQGNSSAYVNAGTYPITTAKDTTAPAAPTGVTVGAGVTTMSVYWNENAENDVKGGVGYYEIQLDTVNTFNSGNLLTKQTGGTITSFSNLTSNTTYYTRVRAVDASGNVGSYSSTTSGTPRYIANADIQAGTINGDRITAATINGDRVIANTLDANVIKANTTFAQNVNVGATFTMATSGIMKSSNYVAGVSGWQLTNTTLEINQGTIKAAALQLQNGHNMLHPAYADFEFVPSWYTSNLTTFNDGGVTTWAISDAVDVVGKYNGQCIKTSWTGVGTFSRVYLGPTFTSYNTQLEANTDYIISGWVYVKTGAGAKTAALGIKLADATFPGPVGNTSIPATSTWTRIWGTFNSGNNTSAEFYLSQYTSGDIYWDGLQLEKKVTADTVPSQWKPPGVTSIDGGIIRTGQIQSTASANGLAGQPAWSINMQGNAQLGDVNVRGRLVVGNPSNPSADGVNSRIHSANYVAGSTGWIIRNDGYAEFRQIAVNSIKVTAFDAPFQNTLNTNMYDYTEDTSLWNTYGSVAMVVDPGAYTAEALFQFTGSGLVFRNGTGVEPIAYDPTILYRVSARVRAFSVATINPNPGFETNTTGWFAYGSNTITRDTTKFFSGVASVRWDQSGSSNGVYGMGTVVSVKPGYTYTFGARVLPNSTVIRDNMKMNIVWKDASDATISTTFNDMPPPVDSNGTAIPIDGTTWIQFSSTGTAPAGAVTASFEVQAGISGSPVTGIQGWFDDVTITTPPRIKVGLFGTDKAGYIIDYDFVDVATTPTKRHAMPTSDFSVLSGYAANQYMMVADNSEIQIATGASNTTADWITLTGFIKGRGGAGATGKFGKQGVYTDEYSPSSFNQEVSYMIPYVEFDVASGSIAQLDQFSVEAYESGAVSKVDTTGTTNSVKGVSIENIQDGTEFDHALRFYTGEVDEKKPGLIGHITDGEMNDAGHLRIVPPLLNTLSNYNAGPFIGIWDQNPNYLYDASFQTGITGWTGMANTTLSWNETVGREDSSCLQITAVGTISNPATTELLAKSTISTLVNSELIGQQVTVSGYAMMGTATGRNVRLVVKFLDEAGSMITGYFIEKAVTNTGWVYYAFVTPVVIPDTCYTIEFSFSWFNGATGDIVYVEDVQLEANNQKTDFRSASASKIELNSEVAIARGPIIITQSDNVLPANIIGTGKRDVPIYNGTYASSDGGLATWRLVNYTDANGTRASAQMTFFGAQGDEQAALRIYGMNDASYAGRTVITNAAGNFALSTYASAGVDMTDSTSVNVRVYGHLDVTGDPPWTAATLTNGSNYSSAYNVAYYKSNGNVYLRGALQTYTKATTMFTLPSGYRPAQTVYLNAIQWSSTTSLGAVLLQVNTNGTVQVTSSASTLSQLSFDGLWFSVAPEAVAPPAGGDTTAPSAPTGFSINAYSSGSSTGTYQLKWTNPSASDTAGVKVIWRTDRYPTVTIAGSGVKTLTTDGTVVTVSGTASQAKTYNHAGIPVNKTIYYRLVSYDTSGNHSTYISASRYLMASPITVYASSSASYRLGYGGMWRNDGDEVYQGDWTGNDNHRGLYFYGSNIYTQLSTGGVVRTPTKMTVYIKRLSTSHGNNSGVGINLRGHTYSSKPSGDPVGGMTNEASAGDDIVFLSRGEAATVTIPSAWYNNFVDATSSTRLKGLGVYGSTTSDYAIMYGRGDSSSYGKLTIYHKG